MKKRTKNYIKYKKKYIVVNGDKYAPYRVEVSYEGYNYDLDQMLIALAGRNTGEETGSGCGFGARDISFDFFTEKGMTQFVKKATKRYGEKFGLVVASYEFSPEYTEVA